MNFLFEPQKHGSFLLIFFPTYLGSIFEGLLFSIICSFGFSKIVKFINIVIQSNTRFTPKKYLEIFQSIEKKLGRKKSSKNSPRTCDIDIISYYREIITGKIVIPHERMHKRNFVLVPLYELDKNWLHPKSKDNIKKLIFSLPIKDITSIKQI